MTALPFNGVSSLQPFTAPGTYSDARGTEAIVWHIRPVVRPDVGPTYEIGTTIRGVEFGGADFDALEPVDREQAEHRGFVFENLRWLWGCTLAGRIPCSVDVGGVRRAGVVEFELPLVGDPDEDYALRLRLVAETQVAEGAGWNFEEALSRLADTHLVCCFTCLYSDYSPSGNGLSGMICHRTAKEQYRATRTKYEVMATQAAEFVLETHLCAEWEQRVPGTGYRG